MRALTSAFATLALFTAAVQAGKRGLAWAWCKLLHSALLIHRYTNLLPLSTGNSAL